MSPSPRPAARHRGAPCSCGEPDRSGEPSRPPGVARRSQEGATPSAQPPPSRATRSRCPSPAPRRRSRNLRRLKWVASRRRFRRSQRVGGNVANVTIEERFSTRSRPIAPPRFFLERRGPRIASFSGPRSGAAPPAPTGVPQKRARRGLSRTFRGRPAFGYPGIVRRSYGAYSVALSCTSGIAGPPEGVVANVGTYDPSRRPTRGQEPPPQGVRSGPAATGGGRATGRTPGPRTPTGPSTPQKPPASKVGSLAPPFPQVTEARGNVTRISCPPRSRLPPSPRRAALVPHRGPQPSNDGPQYATSRWPGPAPPQPRRGGGSRPEPPRGIRAPRGGPRGGVAVAGDDGGEGPFFPLPPPAAVQETSGV